MEMDEFFGALVLQNRYKLDQSVEWNYPSRMTICEWIACVRQPAHVQHVWLRETGMNVGVAHNELTLFPAPEL